MDRVRDLMTPQPATVSPDLSLVQCATKMMELGVRHLPVVQGGEIVGLVDDAGVFGCGALVDGALWFRFDPTGPELASEVLDRAITVDAEADLATALREMEGRSAAIVMEGDNVVGVLSEHDIVTVAETILRPDLTVDAHASAPVHTIRPDVGAQEGLQRMRMLGVRHLVVVDAGKALGVVSLRDLAAGWRGSTVPVERYASPNMKTTTLEQSLGEAAHLMAERNIGCLPVLDADSRPVAILTRSDILQAVATALEDEALFGDD